MKNIFIDFVILIYLRIIIPLCDKIKTIFHILFSKKYILIIPENNHIMYDKYNISFTNSLSPIANIYLSFLEEAQKEQKQLYESEAEVKIDEILKGTNIIREK